MKIPKQEYTAEFKELAVKRVSTPAYRIWSMLPDSVRIPLDILRRCQRWKAVGAIFIHVPKAAGVSVSRALYGRPLGHFRALDIRRVCPGTFDSLLTFGVVRHPIDRLYSAYRFARTGGTGEMGMNNSALYQSDYFSSFNRFVCEWLPQQDISKVDGVFRPQHLYLCHGDAVIVDKVIKLEQIAQGMRELSALLGKEIVLGHHNKLQALPFVVNSAETQKIIERIYQKDFEIFSYLPEQRP
jgi:Sulfotransferase family